MRKLLIICLLVLLALTGCGSGDGESTSSSSTNPTETSTTAEVSTTTTEVRTTTTERPTTTTAPPATFPVTTSGFAAQINVVGPAAGMSTWSADETGDHLFGRQVTDGAAIYLEAEDQAAPVSSAIVAGPPGSTSLPIRIVGMVGGALGDFSVATDVLTAFNETVVPGLGTITDTETTYNVTPELDLTVLVNTANDNSVSFVWTPAGVEPSEVARDATF